MKMQFLLGYVFELLSQVVYPFAITSYHKYGIPLSVRIKLTGKLFKKHLITSFILPSINKSEHKLFIHRVFTLSSLTLNFLCILK